jgi:hypothetical protein
MKRFLTVACFALLLGSLTGCQTCDDMMPCGASKLPGIGWLEKLKHGDNCGCQTAATPCGTSACGTAAYGGSACSTCGNSGSYGYGAMYDGGMSGDMIGSGAMMTGSTGSGCNCGANSSSGAMLGETISIPSGSISSGSMISSGAPTLGGSVIGNRSTQILPGAGE